jgi:hypothetical protein
MRNKDPRTHDCRARPRDSGGRRARRRGMRYTTRPSHRTARVIRRVQTGSPPGTSRPSQPVSRRSPAGGVPFERPSSGREPEPCRTRAYRWQPGERLCESSPAASAAGPRREAARPRRVLRVGTSRVGDRRGGVQATLARICRFRLRARGGCAIAPFPVPATSNRTGRLPASGSPRGCHHVGVMSPSRLAPLSRGRGNGSGNRHTDPFRRISQRGEEPFPASPHVLVRVPSPLHRRAVSPNDRTGITCSLRQCYERSELSSFGASMTVTHLAKAEPLRLPLSAPRLRQPSRRQST